MGVTAHFFAYNPRVYSVPPTFERWLEWGEITREFEVVGKANQWLTEVPTALGDNQRWYDNLAGDFAWACARKHVEGGARSAIDRWLSHLFWGAEGEGCPCGREPVVVAENEVVYDRALLEHVVSLARSLQPVGPALAIEFDGEPPKTERLHRPWLYDIDGFEGLVREWHDLFERALKTGPGWSLLRWVWY